MRVDRSLMRIARRCRRHAPTPYHLPPEIRAKLRAMFYAAQASAVVARSALPS